MGKLWRWLRKLPIARYIKPLWKGALKDLVQDKGDDLQKDAKALLKEHGPEVIDQASAAIDRWQEKIHNAMTSLPIPDKWHDKIHEIVVGRVDELQARIRQAIEQKSPDLLDNAFDKLQEELKERIDKL